MKIPATWFTKQNTEPIAYKPLLIMGTLTFSILLIFAGIFYKERMVFFDVSYQLFLILKDSGFAIQVNRFGAAITQVFPFVSSKIGLSLQAVTILYSLSFILFYFTCFWVVLVVLKNTRMALVLLLVNTLMVTHSFYWIQCELVQGISFTLLFLALLEQQLTKLKTSIIFLLTLPFFIVTIVFFHPLLPFVFFFMLFFFALHYRNKLRLLAGIAEFFLIIYVFKIIFFSNWYDTSAMSGLGNIFTLFPHYLAIQSNLNFIKYCTDHYYWVLILLFLAILFYTITRSKAKLGLLLFFFFGYLFIVNVSFQAGAHQFYLEPQYLVLSVFVSVVLAYDIFPTIQLSYFKAAFIILVLTLGLIRIFNMHTRYSERVAWYRSVIKETLHLSSKKLIISANDVPMDKVILRWGIPYEFWLLSTIEQGETSSIVVEEKAGEFDDTKALKNRYLTNWCNYPYSWLNPPYFILKDTSDYVKRVN